MSVCPKPRMLDPVGHSLLRLIQRRPDKIDGLTGVWSIETAFKNELRTAKLVGREDSNLSTWTVFGDVEISVDNQGVVRTVHRQRKLCGKVTGMQRDGIGEIQCMRAPHEGPCER